jgi:hypothetical protein
MSTYEKEDCHAITSIEPSPQQISGCAVVGMLLLTSKDGADLCQATRCEFVTNFESSTSVLVLGRCHIGQSCAFSLS